MNTINVTESATSELLFTGKKWRARLIEGERWGSKAFYGSDVLVRDAAKFSAGTPIYLDHATATEEQERPDGDPQRFLGVLASDAQYDGDGLYADIDVADHMKDTVKGLAPYFGLSINADMAVIEGERQGKVGHIVESVIDVKSVDLVRRPGAGGKLVSILESESAVEENQKEGTNNVNEETLKAMFEQFTATVLEAVRPAEVETVLESETAEVDVLAVATKLAESELPVKSYSRVIKQVKESQATIDEVINAEIAYLTENEFIDQEVVVEDEVRNVKESKDSAADDGSFDVPEIWRTK